MKTLFHIQTEETTGKDYILLLELGRDYCCYGLYDHDNNAIDEIKYLSFIPTKAAGELTQLLQELKNRNLSTVVAASNYPEALLVPADNFDHDYTLLDRVYKQYSVHYLDDSIKGQGIKTIYSVPQEVYDELKSSFNSVKFVHNYTCSIIKRQPEVYENNIAVYFTTTEFSIVFTAHQQVQLTQTFNYVSALDVVYYLLKVCYEFEVAAKDVHVVLSGLLEKDSGMYIELQNYFINLHFAEESKIKLPDSDHPHYFFNSLYNLASCV